LPRTRPNRPGREDRERRWRHAGIYVGKVLNGAKPPDLPVMQSTKSEMVINRNSVKTLGFAIPQSLLLRADDVSR
jgi:putative ABC transport system substrate-binding protein